MDSEAFLALLSPTGQRLLAEVEAYGTDGDPVTLTTRLRRDHPAPLVSAALTQARLRTRARAKFGACASRMYFTPDGLEQATRASVAARRARRFADRDHVADLCCGIGGDLLAIARAGTDVHGVDRDPLTCAVARANADALRLAARVTVTCADAEAFDVAGYDAVFCDPARRRGGRRVFDTRTYTPTLDRATVLVRGAPGGCVKVAPGIPHASVPDDAEAEWVSDHGAVKEAALWFGDLTTGASRRATLLPSGVTLVRDGSLEPPSADAPRHYLYEPDGAVIRAGLVAEVARGVDGALLDPSIAYVTSDTLSPTPYARAYEIIEALPFALKRLRALLRERGVGAVTIKKRGSAVDVDRFRRDLRLTGDRTAVLVLTRVSGSHVTLLCRPV